MNIIQKFKDFGSQVTQSIFNIFNKKQLDKLAWETGFVQRSSSKIKGSDFVKLMTTEIVQEPNIPYPGLCDRLREINPDADITPQALEQRMNSEGAVKYLEETLKLTIQENLKFHKEKIDSKLLAPFKHIFIEDSTQGVLHEKLANEFKGSGGSASEAAVKIDLVYEYKQDIIHELLISPGATADQSRACSFLDQIQPNDLLLRDLGYFKVKGFVNIEIKKAFYSSRLLPNVDVYLNKEDETPTNLPKYLNKFYCQDNVIELTIYLGKEDKLKTRLIIYRPPQEVVRIRRYEARQKAAKKSRTPTQKYLEWLAFSFFVTNVPAKIWPASVIGTIYRLRWQIELIFKNWKSLLQIHILKGTRPERIKCLIYGRLISIIIVTMLCSFASLIGKEEYQREISFHKVIQWLLRKERLADTIRNNMISLLLANLCKDILRLCKQKRKRKTTKELIDCQIDYMDSFDDLFIVVEET